MASVNNAQILGNIGKDIELKQTKNGNCYCELSVATSERRTDNNGNVNNETTWHKVIVWNKQAENCAKYLSKGRQVFVEGKFQGRKWVDDKGQNRYSTQIVARNVQFVGSKNEVQARPANTGYVQNQNNQMNIPQMQNVQQNMSAQDVRMDDIPF